MVFDSLITVASWEERFLMGLRYAMEVYRPKEIIMFHCKEFEAESDKNREIIKNLLKQKKINLIEEELSLQNYVKSWKTLERVFSNDKWKNKKVLVKITTMPREIIWLIFYLLKISQTKTSYIYFQPTSYSNEWLSQDPEKPRQVFKLSGICEFGKQTLLIIITGYDVARTSQLINFYEPQKTILLVQSGKQFNNKIQNVDEHEYLKKEFSNLQIIPFDSYSQDHGFSQIETIVSENKNEFNVVISSLGPKLSAVSIYKAWVKHQQISLVYAPSKKFNINYSTGMNSEPIIGSLE